MKRLFFRGADMIQAATILFSDEKEFNLRKYTSYPELEVVVQEDRRYSVWGNYRDNADLLKDTCKDTKGRVAQLAGAATEIIEE